MTELCIPTADLNLSRLDNYTWSFDRYPESEAQAHKSPSQVRIETPIFTTPGRAYALALTVANALRVPENYWRLQRKDSIVLDIQQPKGFLKGRWLLTRVSGPSPAAKFFQWIPFVKTYSSHQYTQVQIQRAEKGNQPDRIGKVMDFVTARHPLKIEGIANLSPIAFSSTDWKNFSTRLKQKPFDDPFTQVAAKTLQTAETEFVSERAVQGSCRIVLNKEGQFRAAPISIKDDPSENQHTVRKFRDFLLKEYGADHVEYVQYAYGFDFNEMIKHASPLLPDHVFKMNVGVNNIEMSHVENLYKKLHLLQLYLAAHPIKKPLEDVLSYYHSGRAPVYLCMREIRGLLAAGKGEIVDESSLRAFLDRLIGDEVIDHLPHLSPEQFNTLAGIISLAPEDLNRALTGRQIQHLAICGYKTMGNPNEDDPSRDQAELLQIFPGLQKSEDWTNFYELLAHVAVKKNLFREYRGDNNQPIWRTGVLIPAPQTNEKNQRWYCVSRVDDDGKGNFSYMLLPAVKGYCLDNRPLPMIHLYRSTNSNRNALDWVGSIENDLSVLGSPGSSGEVIPQNVKGGFFFNRTIPLWVALTIYGGNQKPEDAIHSYREALSEFAHYLKDSKSADPERLGKIEKLQSSDHAEKMRRFLLEQAEKARELPKYKKAQDIVFIGHSLGGALAQHGLHYFGSGTKRIPCPGYNFICRDYNGPATNRSVDQGFMAFGRKYLDVLKGLGQHWQIFHQFEYGDFVPEAGENHLGTDHYEYERDREWLDIKIQIFTPRKAACALTITTCPTHGRRIGQAIPKIDYRLKMLSPKKLYKYDHSWILSSSLDKTFGYRIFVSPRITEILRRSIGAVLYFPMHLGTTINGIIYPKTVARDRRGIFSCEYRATELQPQYWMERAQR